MKRKIEISKILEDAGKEKTVKAKVQYLKDNDSFALRVLLSYIIDPNIEFDLPKGPAPFEPSKFNEPQLLYNKVSKLYLFIKNHPIADKLKPFKKETIFVSLLEFINKNEAILLNNIKDKKLPTGLTKQTITKFLADVGHETIIAE